MNTLPVFRLGDAPAEGDAILGTLAGLPDGPRPYVKDGWVGYLLYGRTVIEGRWRERPDCWAFVPESEGDLDALRSQRSWSVVPSYWGYKVKVILDVNLQWNRARFEPADAYRVKVPGAIVISRRASPGSELVKGAWDHEHCLICNTTISQQATQEGYLCSNGEWVCETCYQKHVAGNSISFIE